MRAIIEYMISPYYVLCYIPRFLEIFGGKLEFYDNFGVFLENLESFGRNWKIMSYNFQSMRQIMTQGGVYCRKMVYYYRMQVIFD